MIHYGNKSMQILLSRKGGMEKITVRVIIFNTEKVIVETEKYGKRTITGEGIKTGC